MKSPPFGHYAYELPGGWHIIAGRTDRDNDQLSTRWARPQDWWFHVKGMPGSHVLLKAPEDFKGEIPRHLLETAAAAAAWHSKARHGGRTAVSATPARHVSKPRGLPPGKVQIRKERIFKVRPRLPENYGDS
jgi:predicted ribosome quality control (RQC) complex YloA/Tae2 family protein